jgi:hypothetical protein
MASTALVTGVLTANGGAVFNETGADVDFRVESDTVDHALFVQGSDGFVGIGTSSPNYNLAIGGVYQSVNTDLISVTDTATIYRGTPDGTGFEHAKILSGRDTTSFTYGSFLSFYTEGKNSGTTDTSVERMRIDSSGNLLVGGTSEFAASATTITPNGDFRSILNSGTGGDTFISAISGVSNGYQISVDASNNQTYKWHNGSSQSMTLDSSGNLLVGTTTTSAGRHLTIGNATAPAQSFQQGGTEKFLFGISGGINGGVTGTASGDYFARTTGGKMLFSTDDGVTAHAVIDSSGNVGIGTSSPGGSKVVVEAVPSGTTYLAKWSATGGTALYLEVGGSAVGSITCTASATAYNTSSDYRLKEDEVPMTGATERVKALRPINFAWKVDGSRVDGFLAHEAAEVVPECVTGTKDAMRDEEYEVTAAIEEVRDEDGNVTTEAVAAVMGTRSVPDYQGIDQSKLVPLLTAALQEAITKIEDLTTRLETLENA